MEIIEGKEIEVVDKIEKKLKIRNVGVNEDMKIEEILIRKRVNGIDGIIDEIEEGMKDKEDIER